MKRFAVNLLCACTAVGAYILSAILTGFGGIPTLLLTTAGFCAVQWFCTGTQSRRDLLLRTVLTLLLGAACSAAVWRYEVFYHLFAALRPDYGAPNAGSGFGVLLSLGVNLCAFVFLSLSRAALLWIQNSNKPKGAAHESFL